MEVGAESKEHFKTSESYLLIQYKNIQFHLPLEFSSAGNRLPTSQTEALHPTPIRHCKETSRDRINNTYFKKSKS
jgi:hypothetical protein